MLYFIKHINLIKYLYPNCYEDNLWSYGPGDYSPIINYLGDVLVRHDDSDYQGDTFALVKRARYGFVKIGWGSCSGCDSLQACNSERDVLELFEDIQDSVKWFDTLDEVKKFIESENRNYEYYSSSSAWNSFRDEVLSM